VILRGLRGCNLRVVEGGCRDDYKGDGSLANVHVARSGRGSNPGGEPRGIREITEDVLTLLTGDDLPQVPPALTSVLERLIALLAGDTQRGGRALVVASGDEIFGHAMYTRKEERDREAEFAVVVEDGWKARGLGTLLVSELTEEARRDRIEALTGISLANNHRLLSLAPRVLPGFVCLCSTGTCVIRAPLE
jgi:GNAT superfamily N-acetyltransferase